MNNFYPDDLPLGSLLPFLEENKEVPEGYEIVNGQTIRREDNPEFVDFVYNRMTHPFDDQYMEKIRERARQFFTNRGGEVAEDHITMPTLTNKDAAEYTWGDIPLPDTTPKVQIIIKTRRVKDDG